MSKLSSFPFSPAKGSSVPVDLAFEFEAPRFCDLQDDKYDLYDDYEKSIWFEETHWLHEPFEKRPLSDRAKRKSVLPNNLAAAAAVAKRQLTALMGDGSPDMAKLKRCVTTRSDESPGKPEEERGRGGSFERDVNFSPSRVFAPISENIEVDASKRSRFGAANSPMKRRGPERILFRNDSNKENNEEQDVENENTKIVKGRKSIVPSSRISDEKLKEPAGEGEIRTASVGSRSTEKANGKEEKAKLSLEERTTKSRKSKGEEGELKRKSADTQARKSGDGKLQIEKVRRRSSVKELEEKERIGGRSSGGGNNMKTTKKVETDKSTTITTSKADGKEDKTQKARARKSISVNSLAFINSHSTTYSIPNKLPPSTSLPHPLPILSSLSHPLSPQKPKSEHSPPLSSTLPFLDAAKCVTSLPMRVKVVDEAEEPERREDAEATTEVKTEVQERGGEDKTDKERSGKRRSGEALVSEKPKRTRSSIMTCPVPAKNLQKKAAVPVVEKANPPPSKDSKDKKTIKTKRKSFEFELDDGLAAILEKHNKKFKPVAAYVPRNFSTKDVKMWEDYSGKKWYSLTAAEREEANDWIKHSKSQMQN